MSRSVLVLLSVLWAAVSVVEGGELTFPLEFKFGASTSSYQIEGAWNVSDKSESIWDRLTHSHPDMIADSSNGDTTCKSYLLWRDDVQLVADMGLNFYRFSISWARLMPTGFPDKISEDGRKYYSNLINALLAEGVEPLVTLYHWELPQRLQDLGGWTNPLISDWFADYVRVVFFLFGDRVKTWVTINEPILMCHIAYSSEHIAPGILDPDVGLYICSKNVLLAHAKAWRLYDEEFRKDYGGSISITNQIFWFEGKTKEDEQLADIAMQYHAGLYVHPIFSKEGGWPPVVENIIAEKSKAEGYDSSRLPYFTEEEQILVRGTYDFFGINHYTSRLVRKMRPNESGTFWDYFSEVGIALEPKPQWKRGGIDWLYSYPQGLRNLLVWVKKNFGDVPIMILENGLGDDERVTEDENRIEYLQTYLEQTRSIQITETKKETAPLIPLIVLLAIKQDGVNVVAYSVWSLMDNFEWPSGYTVKFGLIDVDFQHPMRTRTVRKSGEYYANVIRTRSVNVTKFNTNIPK